MSRLKIKQLKKKLMYIKKFFLEKGKIKRIKRAINKKVDRTINRFKNCKNKFGFVVSFLLSSRFCYILLAVLIMVKTNLFYFDINATDTLIDTNFITIQFILITICPLLFIKKDKNRFYLMMLYEVFFSGLLFMDSVYYSYSSTMLSVSQILYVQYAEEIRKYITIFIRVFTFYVFFRYTYINSLMDNFKIAIKKDENKGYKGKRKKKTCIRTCINYCNSNSD